MVSRKARGFIGRKIREQKREGKPQKQAVAIGLSKARRRGFKVPRKKKQSYFEKERLGTLDIGATHPSGVGVKVKRKPPGKNPGGILGLILGEGA